MIVNFKIYLSIFSIWLRELIRYTHTCICFDKQLTWLIVLVWAVSELVSLTYQCPVTRWHIMKIITNSNWFHMLFRSTCTCFLNLSIILIIDLARDTDILKSLISWSSEMYSFGLLKICFKCSQLILSRNLANACKNILPCEGLNFFSSPRYMYWYVSKYGLTNIATVCKKTTIMKPKVWVYNFSSTVSYISAILYHFF